MSDHTKEPWHVGVCQSLAMNIYDERGIGVASSPLIKTNEERLANARRIVACVNKLEGIQTEDLENERLPLNVIIETSNYDELHEAKDRIDDLQRQNAELLQIGWMYRYIDCEEGRSPVWSFIPITQPRLIETVKARADYEVRDAFISDKALAAGEKTP